ncbi:hypothetical protein VI817_007495 [Penicillium citrinum]|nr:hypothetical protein VI817_007495 [Penicillium citrinum]
MTASQVDTGRLHPRRRPNLNSNLPTLQTESPSGTSKMPLRKGETFNTPTSPPSSDQDPILSIRSLPRRAPTSLDAITSSEERMASILDRLTLDDSPEKKPSTVTKDDRTSSRKASGADVTETKSHEQSSKSNDENQSSPEDKKTIVEEGHESDSGLGSSISSVESTSPLSQASKLSDHCESTESTPAVDCLTLFSPSPVNEDAHDQSAITTSETFDAGSTPKRQLGLAACKQIEKFVLIPILKEPKLKPFHPLIRSVPSRIVKKQIVCLRDLEKTLLWLAPVSEESLLFVLLRTPPWLIFSCFWFR